MNIYLSIELVVRELDSKLLLGILAAAKGHHVILSDLESIEKGIIQGLLAPGIFHTKSLTPSVNKITKHKIMIDKGFKISSIDEEAGLDIYGYDEFSKTRYSEQTIKQASAIFGWGSDDVETLKQLYPKFTSKIYKTGSPRADLWKSNFSQYWDVPKGLPNKPFLLISSNMGLINNRKPFHKLVKMKKNLGYFERDSKLFKEDFIRASEESLKIAEFIEAIQYLSSNKKEYDIVLRPHPIENIEAWKFYLEGIPNVHVIREGTISTWVNKAFAVMHNGCTTAFEASVSNKPVITYAPYNLQHIKNPPNEIGYLVESTKELLERVNAIFDNMQSNDRKKSTENINKTMNKKIYLDNNELAADKIIKIWENIGDENLNRTLDIKKFKSLLNYIKFRKSTSKVLRNLFPGKLGRFKENNKFPLFNKNDVYERVNRLQNILGIKGLECKLLSDRTILIKRT